MTVTLPPIDVRSPATGEVIGAWTPSDDDGVAAAFRRARATLPALSALSRHERCDALLAVADALLARSEELERLLVLEQGKPIREARDEIAEATAMLRHVAEDARRFADPAPVPQDPAKRIILRREPCGVVASITPPNFPLVIPIEHIAPALAMGNAIVFKPAPTTTLIGQALADAIERSPLPAGALTCVTGDAATGRAIVAQRPDAICFTGSTLVGEEIAATAHGADLLLELGGNGPTLVFDDADLDRAVPAIASASFYCAGQSCAATERVLVHEAVAAALAERLAAVARDLVCGDPRDPATALGPINNRSAVDKVTRHVEDAVAKGAQVLSGGLSQSGRPTPNYFPATVVADVPPNAALFAEETFGPVVPLTPFADDAQALTLARTGDLGLAASIWTRDLDRAFRVAEALPNGNVTINDHSNYWDHGLPFGGSPGRRSGRGRLGGVWALSQLSAVRTIAVHLSTPSATHEEDER